ncbi:MAG: hypothetical protein ACOVPA_04210 [Rubrivivax sp.]
MDTGILLDLLRLLGLVALPVAVAVLGGTAGTRASAWGDESSRVQEPRE